MTWIRYILMDSSVLVCVAFLFFNKSLSIVFFLPIFGFVFCRQVKEEKKKKRGIQQGQIYEMFSILAGVLHMGKSLESAMPLVKTEEEKIYGENSYIVREINMMLQQIKTNHSLEDVWEQFSLRCRDEAVRQFAEMLKVAKKKGGNLEAICRQIALQGHEKLSLEKEIQAGLSNRILEHRIMSFIPMCILGYMRWSNPEGMVVLYESIFGKLFMSGCLILYGGAYVWGKAIIHIKV